MRHTRIYSIWCDMKKRCNNKNQSNYNNYGGRGIKVCKEWNDDFESFLEWSISNGYNDSLTIDRIDVNGNYEPSNCRWVTWEEQHYNKRNTVYIEVDGQKMTLKEIAEKYELTYSCVFTRYNRGRNVISGDKLENSIDS